MTNYAIFVTQRGTVKGYGMLSSWPFDHSSGTAPVVYLSGTAYCRTDEWESQKVSQFSWRFWLGFLLFALWCGILWYVFTQ